MSSAFIVAAVHVAPESVEVDRADDAVVVDTPRAACLSASGGSRRFTKRQSGSHPFVARAGASANRALEAPQAHQARALPVPTYIVSGRAGSTTMVEIEAPGRGLLKKPPAVRSAATRFSSAERRRCGALMRRLRRAGKGILKQHPSRCRRGSLSPKLASAAQQLARPTTM
jgi:hypothetical protein